MNRIAWIGGLLMVFLLILATNLMDQLHFKRLQTSLKSVYEDRLIVKDHIYNISLKLEKKNLENATANQAFFASSSSRLTQEIDTLIDLFAQTQLTRKEGLLLDDFQKLNQALPRIEKQYATAEPPAESEQLALKSHLMKMRSTLEQLSDIQLIEGKREVKNADKSLQSLELFSRMEIIVLILIGIVIQTLIMIKTSRQAKG